MAAAELKGLGWHLTEDVISELDGVEKGNTDTIKKKLDADLKDVGAAWLNEDINTGKVDYVQGPSVLQLQTLRIISSPKDTDEEELAALGICRLSLTDGHTTCSAVTLEPIRGLRLDSKRPLQINVLLPYVSFRKRSIDIDIETLVTENPHISKLSIRSSNTPPGSKVLLSGTVEVKTNFLLLSNKNTSLLGGWVASLAEPWNLKKNLAKQSETKTDVVEGESCGGPPPFVPFEQKISEDILLLTKKDDFISLKKKKEKKASPEDIEFQKQRQAAVKEALQAKFAKEGVNPFGREQFLINDRDVAWIMNKGFSPGQAVAALKASSGNGNLAVNMLFEQRRNQRAGNRENPESKQLYKSSQSLPTSSLLNDVSLRFSSDKPQGLQSPLQRPFHNVSNSQYIHGYQRYGENNNNHFKYQQQQRGTPPGFVRMGLFEGQRARGFVGKDGAQEYKGEEKYAAGRGGSYASTSIAFSDQNQTSLKDSSQNQEDGLTQNHLEPDQNEKPQDIQKQVLQSNYSNKHNTDNQEGSNTQNSKEQQLQKEQISNTDKPNSHAAGAYKSSSEGQSASSQQQNFKSRNSNQRYGNNYHSRGGSHQPFRGQSHYRSHNEQFSHRAYPYPTYQEQCFTPAFGEQAQEYKGEEKYAAGRGGSYASKSIAFSDQNQTSLKDSSQNQEGGLTQNHLEPDQNEKPQDIQKQVLQSNYSNKHNADNQEGSNAQNSKEQQLQKEQISNTDKPNSHAAGAYRSSSEGQSASSQQQNFKNRNSNQRYGNNYHSRGGSHQPFRGQSHYRSHNEQFSHRAYPYPTYQEQCFTPAFGEQAQEYKGEEKYAAGRGGSYASKSIAFSDQNQTSLKDSSQNQEGGLTQNHLEPDQNEKPQDIQKQVLQSNYSNKHNADNQEGSNAQNSKEQQLQKEQISNTDKPNSHAAGAYRSSSEGQSASSQQQNFKNRNSNQRYGNNYHSRGGSHQPFRGQSHYRSHNEQFSHRAYPHPTYQEQYFTPAFGEWAYNNNQRFQVPPPGRGMHNMYLPPQGPAPFFWTPPFAPPVDFSSGGGFCSNSYSGERPYNNNQRRPSQEFYHPPRQRPP